MTEIAASKVPTGPGSFLTQALDAKWGPNGVQFQNKNEKEPAPWPGLATNKHQPANYVSAKRGRSDISLSSALRWGIGYFVAPFLFGT